MPVVVYLRQNQAAALAWNQIDSNFQALADQVNINTNAIANIGTASGGPTSSRPASPTLYQTYLDTTLGQESGLAVPIWCTQVTPSIIWVNASGESV